MMVHYRKSSQLIADDKLQSRTVLPLSNVTLLLALLLGLLFVSGFWNSRPVHAEVTSPAQAASPAAPG